ncbi:hypothetical protein BKA83DRAFT_4121811 [Pisolithus microcarpus]|nr:hypothetical protein BKA83DRAFT_4121811 [Pisolithus microcarpus]
MCRTPPAQLCPPTREGNRAEVLAFKSTQYTHPAPAHDTVGDLIQPSAYCRSFQDAIVELHFTMSRGGTARDSVRGERDGFLYISEQTTARDCVRFICHPPSEVLATCVGTARVALNPLLFERDFYKNARNATYHILRPLSLKWPSRASGIFKVAHPGIHSVHVLYATEHAFVTALWASTAVPISESAPASILLLAPQEIGDSPWFLIKSPFVHLGRSLRPNPDERARGAHPLGWDDDVAMYWCFKYVTSCVAYRVRPSKYAYDEATLLDDFLQCKIPGQVPAGMPAPGPVEVATNTDREEAA